MTDFATNPTAPLAPMTNAQMADGLACPIPLGQLNWLFQQVFGLSTDGSETKLSAGTDITISGTGTAADPYVISAVNPAAQDASASVRGLVNNASLQELGGVDKKINGVRIGRGPAPDVNNAVLGYNAFGSATTAQNSTAIGGGALSAATSASANTAIGASAGCAVTTGISNTLVGAGAAGALITGSYNVAVGFGALGGKTSPSTCTGIGVQALNDAFGSRTNATGIGYQASCDSDNMVSLGNASVTKVKSAGTFHGAGFVTISDRRNKAQIAQIDPVHAAELSKRVGWRSFVMMQSFASIDADHKSDLHRQKLAVAALKEELAAAGSGEGRPIDDINADLKAAKKTLRKARQGNRDPAAGVIAQELQALTAELGAFEWLVKTNPGGELSVDYTSLFAIVSAGFQARMDAAGI